MKLTAWTLWTSRLRTRISCWNPFALRRKLRDYAEHVLEQAGEVAMLRRIIDTLKGEQNNDRGRLEAARSRLKERDVEIADLEIAIVKVTETGVEKTRQLKAVAPSRKRLAEQIREQKGLRATAEKEVDGLLKERYRSLALIRALERKLEASEAQPPERCEGCGILRPEEGADEGWRLDAGDALLCGPCLEGLLETYDLTTWPCDFDGCETMISHERLFCAEHIETLIIPTESAAAPGVSA